MLFELPKQLKRFIDVLECISWFNIIHFHILYESTTLEILGYYENNILPQLKKTEKSRLKIL